MTRTDLLIAGMRDYRCREEITGALEGVPGVREVDVNLYRAMATIVHESQCTPADLVRAVVRAGYHATLQKDGHRPGAR